MADIQKKIREILMRAVNEGQELGLQVAAYYKGELIVDTYAGVADRKTGRPVDESTLFPVFSTTKGIAATVIHILAERGQLDYNWKISDFWPEFGMNGKENITIKNALNHTAGIPQLPDNMGYEDIVDWDRMCLEVAKLTPLWTPGEHMEYHAITFSWIIGEIARRIDGRPFSQIMKEEICRPLNIKDMYIGIPDEVEPLVAILEEPGFDGETLKLTGPQPIPAWIQPLHTWMNRPDARRGCIPASNGIMTAKAIARHYAALLPGGIDGVELLPPSRIKKSVETLKLPDNSGSSMGMGYYVGDADSIMGTGSSVFGHGGYGGSIGFADIKNHLAFGYVNNLLSNNGTAAAVIYELKNMLGIPLD